LKSGKRAASDAQFTSSVTDEDECDGRRPVKKPKRYLDSDG